MNRVEVVAGEFSVRVDVPGHGSFWMCESDYEHQSGAIMVKADDWATWQNESYAHMLPSGVKRYRTTICKASDVTLCGEIQA